MNQRAHAILAIGLAENSDKFIAKRGEVATHADGCAIAPPLPFYTCAVTSFGTASAGTRFVTHSRPSSKRTARMWRLFRNCCGTPQSDHV
jgi:hypothetical protein